ncbi:hypothetical protein BU26DRAFT_508803 [Trematosphaeria pertusa]|uniref:F-box domain-containing protein n=1 Tax=Trematosphaeria pertusa TaxID=390896 RepID=A0A6A6I5I8_9PLEO|nr:uncharacterized protein BU26DRAFT_508803 [Trematosphaeria pertusa]KAF2244830.1 hypothetical protein BU26DRAFT_508803 [Trematosphaeria pertusa]
MPTEILRAILSYIHAKPDLWGLSLTSRRLRNVTTEFLYANYHYNHTYKPLDEDTSYNDPCLLLRTLSKKPGLARLLKSVSLGYTRANDFLFWCDGALESLGIKDLGVKIREMSEVKALLPDAATQGFEDIFVALLLLTPNVENLSLQLPRYEGSSRGQKILELLASAVLAAKTPRFHKFQRLKSLSLQFGSKAKVGQAPDISAILRIPTLTNLNLIYVNIEDNLTTWTDTEGSSAVKQLSIVKPYFGPARWHSFLRNFKQLEGLHVWFSGETVTSAQNALYQFDRFIRTLQIHQDTLTWLHLQGPTRISIPDHHIQPSLRAFHKLKRLTLDSHMLWLNDWMCQGRAAPLVWTTLEPFIPSTLQELQIYYHPHTDSLKYPMAEQFPTVGQWRSLIQTKQFPNLRRVLVFYARFLGKDYRWEIGAGVSWSRDGPLTSTLDE